MKKKNILQAGFKKEIEWVNWLSRSAKKGPGVIAGIGDDCALVKAGKEIFLLKSDLFVDGVHFTRSKSSLKVIGHRAVARVFSDFAACAGRPLYVGVSVGAPKRMSGTELKRLFLAVVGISERYGARLVGGDTCFSDKFFLDVWGLGIAKQPVLRSGAGAGDYIFLTGPLGANPFNREFKPRLKEAQYLAEKFKISAMIDVSDGFLADLYRILKSSSKGAVIDESAVPVTEGKKDFYRGEDYELIFCVDRREKKVDLLKKKFHLIGRITPSASGFCLHSLGRLKPVKIRGYTHF